MSFKKLYKYINDKNFKYIILVLDKIYAKPIKSWKFHCLFNKTSSWLNKKQCIDRLGHWIIGPTCLSLWPKCLKGRKACVSPQWIGLTVGPCLPTSLVSPSRGAHNSLFFFYGKIGKIIHNWKSLKWYISISNHTNKCLNCVIHGFIWFPKKYFPKGSDHVTNILCITRYVVCISCKGVGHNCNTDVIICI